MNRVPSEVGTAVLSTRAALHELLRMLQQADCTLRAASHARRRGAPSRTSIRMGCEPYTFRSGDPAGESRFHSARGTPSRRSSIPVEDVRSPRPYSADDAATTVENSMYCSYGGDQPAQLLLQLHRGRELRRALNAAALFHEAIWLFTDNRGLNVCSRGPASAAP